MSFYLKALKALLLYPWANVNTISLILHHSDLRDLLLSYSKGGGEKIQGNSIICLLHYPYYPDPIDATVFNALCSF